MKLLNRRHTRRGILLSWLPAFLLATTVVNVSAQEADSHQPPQAQPMGVSTGPPHAAVKDAQARPITAGGFVDGAPIIFQDVTSSSGLQKFLHHSGSPEKTTILESVGSGVALLDYDNDGWLDIYLLNGSTVAALNGTEAPPRAMLFHNNHDGTFTDVTEKAGVAGGGWSTSAAWVDLDGDGFLDLIVLRYLDWDFDDIWCGEHREGYRAYCHPDYFKPIAPLVYHNNHDGTFTEVAQKVGLGKPGKGLGIAIADYDRDGHPDLFLANDSMPEFLYRNRGDGTFEEVGLPSGVAVDQDGRTYAGMGVDFADYNNDGWPDIVVTDLANQRYAAYQNNSDTTFTYATQSTGIGPMSLPHSGWGMRLFDYDNDGWKDLLVAQGHDLDTIELNSPNLHYREPMLLGRNTGHGFIDVSSQSGALFREPWVARGMAIGDLDNDGRLDAVVTTNDGQAHLLHNQTATKNHWILLKLVGHRSNRDAIGAVITLVTGSGQQFETVSTASSYLSASDKRVHFGLGPENSIQKLEIRWPSGIRQTLTNVAADQVLQVDEPAATGTARP